MEIYLYRAQEDSVASFLGPIFLSQPPDSIVRIFIGRTMFFGNCPSLACDVKSQGADFLTSHYRRGSGELMAHRDTSAPAQDSTNLTMPPFQPRPFPPPVLADVPVEYIIEQLRNFATYYWQNTETADCTITVPLRHYPRCSFSTCSTHDPSGLGRRATEPLLRVPPRMSFKLHIDYLIAYSSCLRTLFSGASPLDLADTSYAPAFRTPVVPLSGHFSTPADCLPRLLPSPSDHPVLLLPVPDPSSLPLLLHWIYFGDTRYIDDYLCRGIVRWEGVAQNVEYLGLPLEIRVFLKNWYFRQPRSSSAVLDSEDSDPSSDEDEEPPPTSDEEDKADEVPRGRTTKLRPLSFQDQ